MGNTNSSHLVKKSFHKKYYWDNYYLGIWIVTALDSKNIEDRDMPGIMAAVNKHRQKFDS
jgi:hypothetical protein